MESGDIAYILILATILGGSEDGLEGIESDALTKPPQTHRPQVNSAHFFKEFT